MPLRSIMRYRNPDSTRDLNRRLAAISPKGMLSGGAVTPVVGQLAVRVAPFVAMSPDGMVTLLEGASETRAVQANRTQYLVGRFRYNDAGAPLESLEVLSDTAYAADPDRDNLIVMARVTVPNGATEVLAAHINVSVADRLDRLARSAFRGVVPTVADLPSASTGNVAGDVYVVLGPDPALYAWNANSQSWELAIAKDPDYAVHATNSTVDLRHLTDRQQRALATTPSGAAVDRNNRYVDSAVRVAAWTMYTAVCTNSYDVTLPGRWFVGRASARSTAKQYFRAVEGLPAVVDTDVYEYRLHRQLVGSDGRPITILGVYRSSATTPAHPGNKPTTQNPDGTHTLSWDAGSGATFLLGETVTSGSKTAVVTAQTGNAGATGTLTYRLTSLTADFVDNEALTGATSGKTASVNGTPSPSADVPIKPSIDADQYGFVTDPKIRLNFDHTGDDGFTGRVTFIGLREATLGGIAATGSVTCVALNQIPDNNTQYFTLYDAGGYAQEYQFDFGNGIGAGRVGVAVDDMNAALATAAEIAERVAGTVNANVGSGVVAWIDPNNAARVLLTDKLYRRGDFTLTENMTAAGFQVSGMTGSADALPDGGGLAQPSTMYPHGKLVPLSASALSAFAAVNPDVQSLLDAVDAEVVEERLKWNDLSNQGGVLSGCAPSLPGGRTVRVSAGTVLIAGRRVAFGQTDFTPASWAGTKTFQVYVDPATLALTTRNVSVLGPPPAGAVILGTWVGNGFVQPVSIVDERVMTPILNRDLRISPADNTLYLTATNSGVQKVTLASGTNAVTVSAAGEAQNNATSLVSVNGRVGFFVGSQEAKIQTTWSCALKNLTGQFQTGELITTGGPGPGTVKVVESIVTDALAGEGLLRFIYMTGYQPSDDVTLVGQTSAVQAQVDGLVSLESSDFRSTQTMGQFGEAESGIAKWRFPNLTAWTTQTNRLVWGAVTGEFAGTTPITGTVLVPGIDGGFDYNIDHHNVGFYSRDYAYLLINDSLNIDSVAFAFTLPLNLPRGVKITQFRFHFHTALNSAGSSVPLTFKIYTRNTYLSGLDAMTYTNLSVSDTFTTANTPTYLDIDPGNYFSPNTAKLIFAVISTGDIVRGGGETGGIYLKGCEVGIEHRGIGDSGGTDAYMVMPIPGF